MRSGGDLGRAEPAGIRMKMKIKEIGIRKAESGNVFPRTVFVPGGRAGWEHEKDENSVDGHGAGGKRGRAEDEDSDTVVNAISSGSGVNYKVGRNMYLTDKGLFYKAGNGTYVGRDGVYTRIGK